MTKRTSPGAAGGRKSKLAPAKGGGPHLKVYDGDFGTDGEPTEFLSVFLLRPSLAVGVRPGTVINLGVASDDNTTGEDPNNGYAFGAGANNAVQFLDSDDNDPLNNLNNFWFNPFPDLDDTGVFIS